jgi:hypothetical protein
MQKIIAVECASVNQYPVHYKHFAPIVCKALDKNGNVGL